MTKEEIKIICRIYNITNYIINKDGSIDEYLTVDLYQPSFRVEPLTIAENSAIIQGLISLLIKTDHVFISLLESAHFNRDKSKLYEGVAGNLVAFACKLSFQRGFEGYISFEAKTKLIEHYKRTLNARNVGGNLMIIESSAAKTLIDKYFKL
jgi:hypothetical protein